MLPLSIVFAIGSLVCWILVLVKIFQANQIGLGILGIFCPLFTFIYGWIKSGEWRLQTIMLIWTACIVVNLVLNLVFMHANTVVTH